MRPATEAEQATIRRAAELAADAVTATPAGRRAAVARLRHQVNLIRNPGNLAAVPARELPAAIRRQFPGLDDDQEQRDTVASA
ncbi:hypothetical protein O7626_19475 [Micromonospora sp. WMMD1102]|uniref:hypothetical protein n=1 Tax=Micromonospora sp. WMMD1102 TaxID=3016105 RepID=UPI0024150FF2|nr:hypothetical protein [Micromonospora sp. WMMD1102]MDG4788095.1 hypothetical protein [Micromonospora sp. WMMD1102]